MPLYRGQQLLQDHWERILPVALAATLLLDTFGVSIDIARLGEVARETFFSGGCSISDSAVIAIVGFVAASHYGRSFSVCPRMLHKVSRHLRHPSVCRMTGAHSGREEYLLVLSGLFGVDLEVSGGRLSTYLSCSRCLRVGCSVRIPCEVPKGSACLSSDGVAQAPWGSAVGNKETRRRKEHTRSFIALAVNLNCYYYC